MDNEARDKIRQLMEEIRSLQIQRMAMGYFTEEALQCQTEIFRKFEIIHSITGVASTSVLRMENLGWVTPLTEIMVTDLKETRIPSFKSKIWRKVQQWKRMKEEEEPQYFPSYLYYPNELKVMILEELTSPQDKINLVRAIPNDGEMMNWNENELLFELVFPILMKKNLLKVQDLIDLSNASSSFEKMVTDYFEETIDNGNDAVILVTRLSVIESFEIQNLKIIPACVLLDRRPLNKPDFWNQVAPKIRKGFMFPDLVHASRFAVMQEIQRLLLDLPNLRCLRIVMIALTIPEITDDDRRLIENLILPDLPDLKFLTLITIFLDSSLLWKCLLQKYYRGLVTIRMNLQFVVPELPALSCPVLIKLVLVGIRIGIDGNRSLRLLESFSGSPLKTIRMVGFEGYVGQVDNEVFPNLMTTLSRLFGDTLEDLVVGMRIAASSQRGHENRPDRTWIMDLRFPKLKKLRLMTYPGDWTFLLQCPALETLFVDAEHWRSTNNLSCRPRRILDLTRTVESIKESGIWKMLASLKTIKFRNPQIFQRDIHWRRPRRRNKIYTVSRAECIAFERENTANHNNTAN